MNIDSEKNDEANANFRFTESDKETAKDYKVAIKPEDKTGIAERAEKERQNRVKALEKLDILKKEGKIVEKVEYDKAETSGSQSFTFTAAASEKLAKVCPEEYTNNIEVTEKDIEISKKRFARDIKDAEPDKTRSALKKIDKINKDEAAAAKDEGREAHILTKKETEEIIDREIKSERTWITEFQKSYWLDIMGKKKMKENGLEVTKEEWDGMVEDLKNKINEGDFHNVIPRAGHMNNLMPEQFKAEVVPMLLAEKARKGILDEIDVLQYGNPEEGKKVEKRKNPNPWELASRIRYVLEFLPELKDEIKLTEKGWKDMEDKLKDYREKGDYQSVAYQLCNMKIIEKAGLARF